MAILQSQKVENGSIFPRVGVTGPDRGIPFGAGKMRRLSQLCGDDPFYNPVVNVKPSLLWGL
jgi:hypothetical protein